MGETDQIQQIRGRGIRVLGLPLQFVIVFTFSIAITIYFAGWAASSSVEARSESLAFAAQFRNSTLTTVSGGTAGHATEIQADPEAWESAALWICPLH